ncbi:unnamed protein product, partial [Larinioides sclopetarius]
CKHCSFSSARAFSLVFQSVFLQFVLESLRSALCVQIFFNLVDFSNLQVPNDKKISLSTRLEWQKLMQKMSGRFIGIIAPMG